MRSTEAFVFITPDEDDRFLPEGPRVMDMGGNKTLVWVNIQTGVTSQTGNIHAITPTLPR